MDNREGRDGVSPDPVAGLPFPRKREQRHCLSVSVGKIALPRGTISTLVCLAGQFCLCHSGNDQWRLGGTGGGVGG